MKTALSFSLLLAFAMGIPAANRESETVRLVRQAQPAIVAIFTQGQKEGTGGAGSGAIIHEDGFILTCDHVVQNQPGQVLMPDGSVLPFKKIGRFPEKDLAIIQLVAKGKFPVIPFGRSHDLVIGETALVGGNPGGRGIVFSSGIVSSPAMIIDSPSALSMAQFTNSMRDRFVQFDAASNRGNSGGPLINADGQLIGIVAVKFFKEESINFAIPVDRVRKYFSDMIAAEETGDFWFGLKTDLLTERAVVTEVAPKSPAAAAGIQAGDVLVSAQSRPLRTGLDWPLQITGAKAGQLLTVGYERGGQLREATLTAAKYPMAEPAGNDGILPGLKYQLFHTERLYRLPDFGTLAVKASGLANTLDTAVLANGRAEDYAVIFEGYLRVPTTGLHRLIVRSDDGSRLSLDGAVIIDNDGAHRPMDLGHRVRLAAGLHALKLEYFQAASGMDLKLFLETPDGKTSEVGAAAFYHK